MFTVSEFEAYRHIKDYMLKMNYSFGEDTFIESYSIVSRNIYNKTIGLDFSNLEPDIYWKIFFARDETSELQEYIKNSMPKDCKFLRNLYLGRDLALSKLTVNELQVFNHLDLATFSLETNDWWDGLTNISQNINNDFLKMLGDGAEKAAYLYYSSKFGQTYNVEWSSKYNSSLGYDIKIFNHSEVFYKEIKYLNNSFEFHLSRNEFEKSKSLNHWSLELWSLDGYFIEVPYHAISDSVPIDRMGSWDSCKIRYNSNFK